MDLYDEIEKSIGDTRKSLVEIIVTTSLLGFFINNISSYVVEFPQSQKNPFSNFIFILSLEFGSFLVVLLIWFYYSNLCRINDSVSGYLIWDVESKNYPRLNPCYEPQRILSNYLKEEITPDRNIALDIFSVLSKKLGLQNTPLDGDDQSIDAQFDTMYFLGEIVTDDDRKKSSTGVVQKYKWKSKCKGKIIFTVETNEISLYYHGDFVSGDKLESKRFSFGRRNSNPQSYTPTNSQLKCVAFSLRWYVELSIINALFRRYDLKECVFQCRRFSRILKNSFNWERYITRAVS